MLRTRNLLLPTSSRGTKYSSEWSWAGKHWRLKNWKDSCDCPVLLYVFIFRNSLRQDIRLDRLLFSITTYAFTFQIFSWGNTKTMLLLHCFHTWTIKESKLSVHFRFSEEVLEAPDTWKLSRHHIGPCLCKGVARRPLKVSSNFNHFENFKIKVQFKMENVNV